MTEPDDPLHDATPAETEAALWLARLHADDRTAEDETGYYAWRAVDPAHADAFDRLTEVWELAGGTARAPYQPELERVGAAAPAFGRRAFLGVAATVVLGVGGLGAWQMASAEVYTTGLGEQRRVTLRDGTGLLLDTDSEVRVHLSGDERRLELVRGRCNVRPAPAPQALRVDLAGQELVLSAGTFDVRRDDDRAQVTCFDGTAATAPGKGHVVLAAGQRLTVAPGRPPAVDRPDLGSAALWQQGQLMFDDEPLSRAVAEMNRYSTSKLQLADETVGALRISGAYRIGDNAGFAASLQKLLPVRADRQGDRITISQTAN